MQVVIKETGVLKQNQSRASNLIANLGEHAFTIIYDLTFSSKYPLDISSCHSFQISKVCKAIYSCELTWSGSSPKTYTYLIRYLIRFPLVMILFTLVMILLHWTLPFQRDPQAFSLNRERR